VPDPKRRKSPKRRRPLKRKKEGAKGRETRTLALELGGEGENPLWKLWKKILVGRHKRAPKKDVTRIGVTQGSWWGGV